MRTHLVASGGEKIVDIIEHAFNRNQLHSHGADACNGIVGIDDGCGRGTMNRVSSTRAVFCSIGYAVYETLDVLSGFGPFQAETFPRRVANVLSQIAPCLS